MAMESAADAPKAEAAPRLRMAQDDIEPGIAETIVESAQQVMAIGSDLAEIVDRVPWAGQVQLAAALDLMGVAVTAMFACVDEGCDMEGLKLSPIESRPRGPNRDLILKCRHDPPHCWDRTGTKIVCPP